MGADGFNDFFFLSFYPTNIFASFLAEKKKGKYIDVVAKDGKPSERILFCIKSSFKWKVVGKFFIAEASLWSVGKLLNFKKWVTRKIYLNLSKFHFFTFTANALPFYLP